MTQILQAGPSGQVLTSSVISVGVNRAKTDVRVSLHTGDCGVGRPMCKMLYIRISKNCLGNAT